MAKGPCFADKSLRLTKLEINGFKSFAKKTEICFDQGITAIIGPNGSGKSNIADAVRWVLGEQSAKALRGARMEDVIFNGTQERKPQAYCEVGLTFDNSDGRLPVDFSEVTVMRRVYRSGESEYLINRNTCRLKDIHELFRDTGIGKEGYSIIGQGKVEEILSNKSNDRRAAFEEAAGVMKFRVRKEEAERKLDNTQKNLLRINDILTELKDRVEPLEQQSEVARQYLALRDELKEIEVNLFLYQYDKAQERIKSLGETQQQLSEELESTPARETELAGNCGEVEAHERALESSLNELQQKLISLSAGVEARSGEAKLVEERIANIQRERGRIDQTEAETQARFCSLEQERKTVRDSAGEKQRSLEDAAAQIRQAQERLTQSDQVIADQEQRLEECKNSIIEAMNRISDARSQLSRYEAMEHSIHSRMEQLDAQEKSVQQERESLQAEYDQAVEALTEMEEGHKKAQQQRQDALRALAEHDGAAANLAQERSKLEGQRQAQESRLKVLSEMKRAHEGYYSSVRNVLRDRERDVELNRAIEGVVAELIHVPGEYVTAVEMTLGSALQNIVTPDEPAAKRVIEHLRRREYGRATLLPVSVMRPRLLTPQERQCLRIDGCLGVASELVSFDERYRGIAENLLGRTVIVRDLDVGIALSRQVKNSFRIATLKGDIINQGGSMTGGSAQKREFSLLGREQEISELTRSNRELVQRLEQKEAEQAAHAQRRKELEQAAEDCAAALHNGEVLLARERDREDIIRRDLNRNQEDRKELEEERGQLRDNLEQIARQRQEAQSVQSGLEQGNTVTQDDVRRLQKELAQAREAREIIAGEVTAAHVAQAGIQKELAAYENDQKRLLREQQELERQQQKNRQLREQGEAMAAELTQSLKKLGASLDVGRKDVSDLNDQVHKLEEERQAQIKSLAELRAARESAADALRDMRERQHRAELSLNKAQMELANMQDRIWNDYALTYENALPLRRSIAVTASHLRIDELKQAIRELGDINLNAIEDYKAVKERFDSLSEQYQDLTTAKEDLTTLIQELIVSMEREFREQFALIQQNFAVVFTELFGGGRAELVLSDPNDILNCDIDIIAQPPGKKLQLLSLLSGGERALTAIALLFAILKLKPTAFCVLDEIESSLDEANVTNFAEYLKAYTKDTQFILITHRRGSMEASNALYGVAMEEKGVSKVVSARFNEAV